MNYYAWRGTLLWASLLWCAFVAFAHADVPVDVTGYSPSSGVRVEQESGKLRLTWPLAGESRGELVLNTSGRGRLIESLAVAAEGSSPTTILSQADPAVFVTVGSRVTPPGQPPDRPWVVFFDNPHKRPHDTFAGKLQVERFAVSSRLGQANVAIDSVTAGPLRGRAEISVYPGCPLIRLDFVLTTDQDGLAIFYDSGLFTDSLQGVTFRWQDAEGKPHVDDVAAVSDLRRLPVKHRMLVWQSKGGSLVCFPLPHQFQFPRDWTDNLSCVWYGRNHHGLMPDFGFGIRQNKDGGGNYVPWFNAPPGVPHRMGLFLLATAGDGQQAMDEALKYTHQDRFVEVPGYVTMASHWHMAIAMTAMEERRRGLTRTHESPPDYVRMFKEMGVNLVHLGEFHGDGHQQDPGPLRLPEMEAMFRECRQWSDDRLLLIPGEEVNTFLGLTLEGKHPGHWMSLFPRPVYWTMRRAEGQPFVEDHPTYGKVYHVGGRADMVRLIKEENALVWAAHPRIKASSWTPDIFRQEDFFIADSWLGGAWKAMPGDLSRERLGERVLDLLDDMANWGHKKYVLGEVDVFKINPTHELYGHMNVNYVQLPRVPRYEDGWRPVLDALREGKFFVTTGEVLLPTFTIAGKHSGEEIRDLHLEKPAETEVRVDVHWTFPLSFAELVSGDGQHVYRQRWELGATGPFGQKNMRFAADLRGRRWARLEVWDIAANGAFTQPVWIGQ